nr:bifunctional oligoribonuclease/PAP phosphatase NrnA [uncultured Desulfobulbus sp.]
MTSPDLQVQEAVREKGHILLATHFNPDGDALGSLLGLAEILEGMGKEVLRFLEDPVTHIYRFLPGCGQIQTDIEAVRAFVGRAGDDFLALCLDCGDEHRLGRFSQELVTFRPLMVIDHHKGNNGFGDGAWIEPQRSSTGEMIFDLATALGAKISERAAECLYVAINTDTGSFRYESTSAHTFAVAGQLVQCGVRPEVVANQLYDNSTLGRLRLMQEVLSTLEMHERDRIAVIRVTQNMLERTFTTMADTEYFINFPRAVATVRVAVFLKEIEPGYISVSLRAKGQCDVSVVAARFGGGGHRNASGCRFKGETMDSVRDTLVELLRPLVLA